MKNLFKILPIVLLLVACGGGEKNTDSDESAAPGKMKMPVTLAEAEANFEQYQGIGPIKPFDFNSPVNEELAEEGKAVYASLCSACHKPDKKFVGPSPSGIFTRRTPAWTMNMILNPEQMLAEDPIAKLLYVEYNMSPMANQNLTEDQARAVLEYFRTL